MLTRTFLLTSVIMSASFAQAIQPAKSGTARGAAAQSSAPSSTAVVYTATGNITSYTNEWLADAVLVSVNVPYVDLGCQFSDKYETLPSDPANHVMEAELLAAFLSGKTVSLALQGCSLTRPRIIGVYINP